MPKITLLSVFLLSSLLAVAQNDFSKYFERKMTDPSQIGIPAGEYFPTTKFLDIDQQEITFDDKDYELTIINFWFKACKACISEKPYLKKLTEHYKDNSKVRFISITPTNIPGVEKTIKKYGDTNYKVISLGSFKQVEELFHFKLFPRHSILDNNARVLAQYITPIPTDEFLEEYIRRIDSFLEKNK